jgi:glycerol-3-phosphate acyltransferase PlsX
MLKGSLGSMSTSVRIALDAMGGDHGPSVVIPGAAHALKTRPDIQFLLYGDEAKLAPYLAQHPELKGCSRVIHTDVAVAMDDKPSQALRRTRKSSSMWMAIEAVKNGDADVTVSAGNTGALMAMSTVCLRTMAGIERPAIAAMWPTMRGRAIVLDVGATIGADAQHLVDLAIMGSAMARIVLNIETPTVGLLNVGVEEIKGIEEVKAASRILREGKIPSLRYQGFVEGDDIGKGTVDVVVTEGFTGNIALKTAEGTAKQLATILREGMQANLFTKLGYLLARSAFQNLKSKMDPSHVNGGVFLGLDGIVIKSHGGTDVRGFSNAVGIGFDMVRHQLLEKIRHSLAVSDDRRITITDEMDTRA